MVEQIKKLLCYNPEWENKIADSGNRIGLYLAAIELNNWNSIHVVHEQFGRLQEKLDLGMGFSPL